MLYATIILAILVILAIFFISPLNIFYISGMILLMGAFTFTLMRALTKRRKYAVLSSIYIVGLLSMSYVLGFNLLNTALLSSFIIGLGFLLN